MEAGPTQRRLYITRQMIQEFEPRRAARHAWARHAYIRGSADLDSRSSPVKGPVPVMGDDTDTKRPAERRLAPLDPEEVARLRRPKTTTREEQENEGHQLYQELARLEPSAARADYHINDEWDFYALRDDIRILRADYAAEPRMTDSDSKRALESTTQPALKKMHHKHSSIVSSGTFTRFRHGSRRSEG
eukprot:6117908-Amphidinium_carterae.1